jgi:NADH-quinone oxidoreductase subunit M
MIALLLIVIPLVTGLAAFFIKNEKAIRSWALFSFVITLIVSFLGLTILNKDPYLSFNAEWLGLLGSEFSVRLDGMGQLLCLLTALSFPLVLVSTWKNVYSKSNNFFGLMLLTQAGLMGVFLAMDALLFYFFWELALVPMYFLCSQWGGEKRIPVTFKFFIYTFVGSILMLIGILIVQAHTKDHSFSITSFYSAQLTQGQQAISFWLFFIAFAIKMPIFPFHTWQPDLYDQSPTAVTMILSGVMVKMGVFATIRWLLPVLPISSFAYGETSVMVLSVIGILYASLLAIRQDNIKKLIAYMSIAHIGLMCMAIFAEHKMGMQGVMIQMFNHGINIIGLWIIVEMIEKQFGTKKISELSGLALKAPAMTMFLVIIVLANIGLPLTNAFIGEFLMFNGIFSSSVAQYYLFFTVAAGISIILVAVYMLNFVRKAFLGNTNAITETGKDIGFNTKLALSVIVIIIIWLGIYPNLFLDLTNEVSESILKKSDITPLLDKTIIGK